MIMKRILQLAASAALLFSGVSCEKAPEAEITQLGGGDFLKSFSLSFDSTPTRSTESASEDAINNATIFVYQSVDGGEEVLFQTAQASDNTAKFALLFNDALQYSYRFEAYANMGTLSEKPSKVLFSNESLDGLQMHGTLANIDQNSAATASVSLERYVGKVAVNSVTLYWKKGSNASSDFILKRIYLANTSEEDGGEATYNVGGALTSSAKDMFLVSEVNQVIDNYETYSIPHYLYGYGAEGSALVLECEWAGNTMYYHLDCPLASNNSVSYDLTIHQTGSLEPLGSITDGALKSVTEFLASTEWEERNNDASFGALPQAPIGASIYCVDGEFYTAEEWAASGKPNNEAIGVAVSDGEHSFVIHPTALKSGLKWSSDSHSVENAYITESAERAVLDFAGEANTTAILAAIDAGKISDAPAAQYAASIVFAHKKKGYLPAAGELSLMGLYITDIRACMTAIDGKYIGTYAIWTSTQKASNYKWTWEDDGMKNLLYYSTASVLVFAQIY